MTLAIGGRTDGSSASDRAAPAGGRDAGQHDGDLLRQDRHADRKPDDGARALGAGDRYEVSGDGYAPIGTISLGGDPARIEGAALLNC